jgi:nicotinate-nucleotide--dimethylbenzimidazole phosphoribosyltransferase
MARKIAAVEAGVARHRGLAPMDLLAALGGWEQAAICGAVLQARMRRVPVILDGFICTAAVSPLFAAGPEFLAHCLAGHVSAEAGHRALLARMGLEPILDLGMRLGEGTGAALALGVVRAALACHDGMATFDEAGVSGG